MDDAQLVALAQGGDRDAFGALVQRHQDGLYTLALRMLGHREDAADVVQEAFLRSWDKIRTLRQAPFKHWLYRIAVNLCRDHQRARKVRGQQPDDAEDQILRLRTADPGPESVALQRERLTVLAKAITSLPEEFRAALVLRDVNDLSYEQVAEILEVPVGTVKSRLSRGRLQVHHHLLLYPELFQSGAADAAEEVRHD